MRGSRNFRQGGPGQTDKKSSGSIGGPTFSRGGGEVGGSNCLFPIETHITCDFPGGGLDPLSPLWIRTWEDCGLNNEL